MSVDPQQFAVSVLNGIGAPINHENVASLMGWASAEGGAVHNNPYNTTEGEPGATTFNSVGVKSYTGYSQAVDATIKTLKNGDYNNVIGALKSSDPNAFVSAVGGSLWGTSGSLLNSTVHAALSHNYGIKAGAVPANVGVAKTLAAPASSTVTTQPKVSIKQSGGGVDWSGAITDALLQPTAINTTTGTPPSSGGLLSRVMDAVNTGAYTTPVTNTVKESGANSVTTMASIAKTKMGQSAITGKAVADAQAGGANADAMKLLHMLHNVNGSAYNQGNHDDINERDVNIKAAGTDCSGLVSWLMGPHGLGIWSASLATPSIDTAPGMQAGHGKVVTVWNNSNPGNSGHVFIQIGNGPHAQFWASEGGVGIHQLPLSEVQNYWTNGSDGGHYVPLHPKGL